MKRFSKTVLVDMLVICNVRSDNGMSCHSCEYYNKCEDMYSFYDKCSKGLKDKVEAECQRILFKE